MTRFTFQGSGQTVGGDGKALIAVGAAAGVCLAAWEVAKSAARTAGDLLVVIPVALGGIAVGVAVTLLAVRLQGRRRARTSAQPAQLWRANPQAIPVQSRRELPAPVVNVNIDAGLLAGLMEAARQQPAPVMIQAETGELPR